MRVAVDRHRAPSPWTYDCPRCSGATAAACGVCRGDGYLIVPAYGAPCRIHGRPLPEHAISLDLTGFLPCPECFMAGRPPERVAASERLYREGWRPEEIAAMEPDLLVRGPDLLVSGAPLYAIPVLWSETYESGSSGWGVALAWASFLR